MTSVPLRSLPTPSTPRAPLAALAAPLAAPAIVLAAVLVASASPALAQGQIDRNHVPSEERVDLFDRRQTDLDANVLRTTVFNFGLTGRNGTGPNSGIPYEWPKNTRRNYIALTGLFTGAEVVGENGDQEYILNVPIGRTSDVDPNASWTWSPIGGYVNPADEDLGVARSDRSVTWPSFWPDKLDDPTDPGWSGSWSGLFGKDVFNADLEVFYKMGDDEYARPSNSYYPDSTDRNRRGLGLIADTRVLAWSQVLIDDVAFILHKIKNDGTQDLTSVGVTLWLADLVGGDPDASDDQPFFDLLLDTAFLADSDGRSNDPAFEGVEVEGAIAFFLETPGNATDRIDNDGDGTTAPEASDLNFRGLTTGEPGSPTITLELLAGEGDQGGPAGRRLPLRRHRQQPQRAGGRGLVARRVRQPGGRRLRRLRRQRRRRRAGQPGRDPGHDRRRRERPLRPLARQPRPQRAGLARGPGQGLRLARHARPGQGLPRQHRQRRRRAGHPARRTTSGSRAARS